MAINGLEVHYSNESEPCDFFASDNYGSHYPSLSVNYVQDLSAPGGSLSINGGSQLTNSPWVTLSPTAVDGGATDVWNSNWSSVNGVGSNGGTQPSWSASGGSMLTANTSTCGSSNCAVQTFFTNTISNMSDFPTFTASFQSDLGGPLNVGVVGSGNDSTRYDLVAPAGGSAFTTLEYSTSLGSYTHTSVNIPFSANTWYNAQIDFPASNVGEIYIWPEGQARPSTPTVHNTMIAMSNPGLNFWEQGANGSNQHQYEIGNVTITDGTTGYGAWGVSYSNDNVNWLCPWPPNGTCATWAVVSNQQLGWYLGSGDGLKNVYFRYVDNAGNVSGTGQYQMVLDTTPPNANFTYLPAGQEVRGVVTVNATASDTEPPDGYNSGLASVSLFADGQQVGSAVTTSSTPSFLWDTSNLAPGPHTLQLEAIDNAGNIGWSQSVTVDVSNAGQMSYETFDMQDLQAEDISAGVNVATGNGLVTEQDLDVPGLGPDLTIDRDYNSMGPIDNLFGWGWTSDLDEGLVTNADGSVTYRDASGGFHIFLPNGSGGFVTPYGLNLTLTSNTSTGGYTLTARDQTQNIFNGSGYLTSVVDRNGNTLSIAYNGSNLPTTVTDASGRQLVITTSGGHITQINAPGSRIYQYGYDGNGNLTSYTDPSGVVTEYGYTGNHLLTTITLNYQSGGTTDQETNVATTLSYDTDSRLLSLVDPLGYPMDVSYGSPGSGTTTIQHLQTNSTTTPSSSSPVYATTSYVAATNNNSGAIGQVTDPMGGVTTYSYDQNDDTSQVTDPDGHVMTATYDSNGNLLTQIVDPGGSGHLALTTTYTYDADNNVLSKTDPDGIVTQYTYDSPAAGNLVKEVENYDVDGPVNSSTNITTSYTYNSSGEMLTQTDPVGIVTQHTYDSQGDVLSTTQNYQSGGSTNSSTNVTTSTTYDVLGQKLTITNALGFVTQYTYDVMGNLLKEVDNYVSGGQTDQQTNVTTSYGIDALNRVATVTDPRGYVTKTVYDADGRPIQAIRNYVSGSGSTATTNVTSTTAYNAAGDATLSTDANGNTTTTSYDLDGRPIEVKVVGSASSGGQQVSETLTTYDHDGNVLTSQVVDGATSPTTSHTYDAAGRVATEAAPPADPGASGQSGQSNVTTTTYDADGNVLQSQVTNAALSAPVSTTTQSYDPLGRVLTKTEQSGTSIDTTTTYTYDADGHQLTLTDNAGHTSTMTYDPLGRVTVLTRPDNSQTTTTYDAAGELLTVSNSAGTTSSSYDPLGRLLAQQITNGAGVVQTTVAYTYDADGNMVQKQTTAANNSTTTVNATYDPLGRQITMTDGNRSYTYDANGNVLTMQVQNSGSNVVGATYSYDGGNRLTTMTTTVGPSSTELHSYSYTYDGDDNLHTATTDGSTTTYTYDANNQLTQVQDSSGTTSYTYDANHNRTSMTTSAGASTYTYDSSADVELTQMTDPSGKVTTYGYDSNGNLTTETYDPSSSDQVTTFTYDQSNRLTSVDLPDGTTVSYTYDANDDQTSTTVTTGGASPTTTVVNNIYVGGKLTQQTDGNGNLLATFTYNAAGEPVSVQVGNNLSTALRYYYIYGGQGNVVALTDASGNVVASYSYDPFGVLLSSSENFPNGWSNPFRYDGRDGVLFNSTAGLYWMQVRAYDPTLGRFLSRDPLSKAPLFFLDQPYAYAGNNPVTNVDPTGQMYFAPLGGGSPPPPQPVSNAHVSQAVWNFISQNDSYSSPLLWGSVGVARQQAQVSAAASRAPATITELIEKQVAFQDHLAPGGVPRPVTVTQTQTVNNPDVADLSDTADGLSALAGGLTLLGGAADFLAQAHDYSIEHPDAPAWKPIAYGFWHAAISTLFILGASLILGAITFPLAPITVPLLTIASAAIGNKLADATTPGSLTRLEVRLLQAPS